RTALTIAPRMVGEIRHLTRAKPEARDVVKMKVLKLERSDRRLAALQAVGFVLTAGHQLRRDHRLENGTQRRVDSGIELPRFDRPPNEVLNQRLRHRGVHMIV